MKTVHEKIAHSKLEPSRIRTLELEILKKINYKIHAPTVLDFLKVYLLEALDIHVQSRTFTRKKEESALACCEELNGNIDEEMKDSTADSSKDLSSEEKDLKV